MLPAVQEVNINKVVKWLQKNPESYPAVGNMAFQLAVTLGVSPVEVNIANKRMLLGLVPKAAPEEPKPKPKASKPVVVEDKKEK